MSTSPHHFADGRIRQPESTSEPSMLFDVYAEVERLNSEQPWQAGHTANTLVKYPDLRVILVAIKAGARLHYHRTIGRITIHCLSGHIRVDLENEAFDLSAGELLAVDRDITHDVFASSDSTFLLTIAWPPESPTAVRGARPTSADEIRDAIATNYPEATNIVAIDVRSRERGLDKTLADTFPCSDALSSCPDPELEISPILLSVP